MRMRRTLLFPLLLALVVAAPARAADPPMQWSNTELAGHVRAWFESFGAPDDSIRAMLARHMAPSALADVGIEQRLARRKAMMTMSGVVTPLAIVAEDAASMAVRAKQADGEIVTIVVEAEPDSPHRLVGVRVNMGDDVRNPGAAGGAGAPGGPGSPTRILAGSGGPGAPTSAGGPLDDAAAIQAMQDVIGARAKADSFAGAVLLARGGKPIATRAYGLSNREAKSKNTPETRFNVGSIGKIFTRAALAQLAEQGKVNLDDKLSKYLPDFPHAEQITLDMLATHRSGVGDFFASDQYDAAHAKLKHNHDYLELIRNQPLWFEPGTSKRYSNGGYVLLGEVIARASGEDYYDYMQKHVYGPAGMTATGAPLEGDGSKGLARGYTLESGKGYEDNVTSRPTRGSAAGGSYSTVSDLLSLDQALVNAKLCGQAWSDWVIGGPRPDLMSGVTSAGGAPSFSYAGGAPGISAEWMHEGDRTLILLTNQDPPLTGRTLSNVRPIFERMMPAPRPAPAP